VTRTDEAFTALADPDARVIAGGQSLLPMMKLRFALPTLLVDIAPLDWRGVDDGPADLRIGALTTYDELLRSRPIPGFGALYECASQVGDLQVRNAGTVGGGLAHGDPAADFAAGALALRATLLLESADGVRKVGAENFFLGPFTTVLKQAELLTAIVVPRPAPTEGSAYVSIEDPASGYPLAGAAVRIRLEGSRVAECSIGITGATAQPFRARAVEELFVSDAGETSRPAILAALANVTISSHERAADDYRRHLVAAVIHRSAERALRRAETAGEK
jgi:aerobic carbon-monoxide dehydrogenase medium subunit